LLRIDTRIFDYKYNVKTYKDTSLQDLQFDSINKKVAVDYETIPPFSINKILNSIDIHKEDVFVDFGCGKGRVLLVASQYRFKKIVGIEFSPELVDIARFNINICKKYNNFNIDRIEIIKEDVLDYKYNNDESVFYLFNPFSNIILDPLCDQIIKSINRKPRRVYILYYHPKFENIIIDKGFKKIDEINTISKSTKHHSKQSICCIFSNE